MQKADDKERRPDGFEFGIQMGSSQKWNYLNSEFEFASFRLSLLSIAVPMFYRSKLVVSL